jgi:acetyl esterase/lipase
MGFSMDPEVQVALAPLMAAAHELPSPPIGDWHARRVGLEHSYDVAARALAPASGVQIDEYVAVGVDGTPVPLLFYRPTGTDQPRSAALYLHGGGMIAGWHRTYDLVARGYVAASGVSMLAVDYRVAPEHPGRLPVEDCYTGLVWLAEHACDLGIDPTRIAVLGGSAGGGLAAGVALLARDRGGPHLAQQLLLYPMLDDRTATVDPQLHPFVTWTHADNITGWGALLGERVGGEDVSPYIAPARCTDLSGLPPTYIDVGELDIFRDESIEYARRLTAAGVPAELHLHPGTPHAFDVFAPDAAVSHRAIIDRVRRLKEL